MDSINIILKPHFKDILAKMGYDENDDYNSDAVLHMQGYNMRIMEVECDETFTISNKFELATVDCDGKEMKLLTIDEYGDVCTKVDDEQLILEEGQYLFHSDGKTIEQLQNP